MNQTIERQRISRCIGQQLSIVAAITLLLPCAAFAGGLELYELGTPGLGLASAGEAARAQDASTLFTNPAGMTLLERSQLLVGAQALYGDAHFDRDENTTTPGSASGNPVGFFPGGSFFYVNDLTPDWKVGFGSFSYFGLPLDFANKWSGRYYSQDNALLGLTFMPSVAYKVSDHLSFGVGLNAMYGIVQQQVAINNLDPRLGDGKLDVRDEAWGFGADVGVLYEVNDCTRFGLRYLSEVDLGFEPAPEYTNLGPGLARLLNGSRRIDMGMTVPTDLMLSGYHALNDDWALLGSTGWQQWSKFGKVDVAVTSADTERVTTIDLHAKDTWHVSGGVQNTTLKEWVFSAGMAYDSSMFDDQDRPITMPVGEVWRFGVGAQYLMNADVTLGFAYELGYAGDMKVDQERGPLAGRISGQYGDTMLHYWAFSLQYKL
jgi:long-chain fatty acid transport protein